jgi:hypothetical protein
MTSLGLAIKYLQELGGLLQIPPLASVGKIECQNNPCGPGLG